jgi:hypothetical protein
MAKEARKPAGGWGLGKRTQQPHHPKGWVVPRDTESNTPEPKDPPADKNGHKRGGWHVTGRGKK